MICKLVFNDQKYKDLKDLSEADLVGIQMLKELKDRKEMATLKDQFIINEKVLFRAHAVQPLRQDTRHEAQARLR